MALIICDKAALRLRAQAEDSGFISKDWGFLATPLLLARSQADRLIADLARLEDLIFSLPDRVFGGSMEKMAIDLGVTPELAMCIGSQPLAPTRFPLRWDLIGSHDHWRVLEINTGFCLGGLNTAGMMVAYRDVTGYEFLNTDQILGTFISKISSGRIHVVEFDELISSYGFFAKSLAEALARNSNCQVTWGPLSQLEKGLGNLNGVIPMMTFQELALHDSQAAKLLLLQPENSLLHPAEILFTDKGILAWLYEPWLRKFLTEDEKELIARLVPKTQALNAKNVEQFLGDSGQWVLKPCASYGGEGIVCQWTVMDWSAQLAYACNSGERWVVQQAVKAEIIEDLVTVMADGTVARGFGEPVLGLITVEKKLAGGFSRVLLNVENPGVTNAHCGAASGWVVIKDEYREHESCRSSFPK